MLPQTQGQYANTAAQSANAPKEIGLIQRVEGVRDGLDQIHSRLRSLAERIAGSGSGGVEKQPEQTPIGIPANLNIAESRIRQIMEMLTAFESSF